MRIAIFTDTYAPDINGVSLTLQRWVTYLKERNIEVKIFAPEPEKYDQQTAEEAIIRYKSFPFFLYPELRAAVLNPLKVNQSLDEFQPTLIHVATPFNLGIIGRSYALKNDIPLIASYHTNFNQYLPAYHLEWADSILESYLYWFHEPCAAVFAPSKVTAIELIKKDYPNVKVWSRGIEADIFAPALNKQEIKEKVAQKHGYSSEKITILYTGRLALEKSLDTFMEVVRHLPEDYHERIQFVLAGDGPYRPELEAIVAAEQLDNVHFIGFIQNEALIDVYQSADLFFFPSHTETFGNVVLEAMATGLPVLGANAGGVQTLVTSLSNGILCPPNNTDSFANALKYLIDNNQIRQAYGESAREFALAQSWEAIFDELLYEYQVVAQKTKVLV